MSSSGISDELAPIDGMDTDSGRTAAAARSVGAATGDCGAVTGPQDPSAAGFFRAMLGVGDGRAAGAPRRRGAGAGPGTAGDEGEDDAHSRPAGARRR